MDKGSKIDFTGQPIYVGMDIHKKSWSVSIHTEHFEHKTFTQPPEVKKLTDYLQEPFREPPIMPYMKPASVAFGYTTNSRKKESVP